MLHNNWLALSKHDMENLKFKLERAKNAPVSDEEILSDLRRVSGMLYSSKVTQKLYGEHGHYDYSNVGRRFGTWNKALEAAGLSLSNQCKFPMRLCSRTYCCSGNTMGVSRAALNYPNPLRQFHKVHTIAGLNLGSSHLNTSLSMATRLTFRLQIEQKRKLVRAQLGVIPH